MKLILLFVCCLAAAVNCTQNQPKVIIIGAGAAGIAASTKLLEKGINDIIILEAMDRIGGRIFSKKVNNITVDMGAQWCHGEKDNVVFELASPLGLLDHSVNTFTKIAFYDIEGTAYPRNDTYEIDLLIRSLEAGIQNSDKQSLGEYFLSEYKNLFANKTFDPKLTELIFEWWSKVTNSLDASESWFDVSLSNMTEYTESEGDFNMNWKGKGYHTILDVMMKKIPDPSKALPIDDKIHLNKEVTEIIWDGPEVHTDLGGVSVKCKDGSVYKADHVIVTVSLGVLKERYQTLFVPKIPETNQIAIEGLTMGTCDKITFVFPHRWWPEDNFEGFMFLWLQKHKDSLAQIFGGTFEENEWLTGVIGFIISDDQPNILTAFITGRLARQFEAISESVVKEKLMKLFKLSFGSEYTIPEPVAFLRSTWHANPYTRGSYSYFSIVTELLKTGERKLATPISNSNNKKVVLFAGEATSYNHYATVHGAIESGWREVNHIV